MATAVFVKTCYRMPRLLKIVSKLKLDNIYNKLSKALNIDQKVVSGCLLAGFINILSQHDELKHHEEILLIELELKLLKTGQ